MKQHGDFDHDSTAAAFQALSHPVRLRILRMLARRDACCCKDVVSEIGLAQSTVSQHLKVLVEAGLVHYRPERQASRYSMDGAALRAVSEAFGGLVEACCQNRATRAQTKADL
jgi:ArsR family transcriptional regulator, arsenate/arsenite/antimonite-responsive transcriptional repressor